ncbi:MAG: DUF3617 family protein, partial [Proteobacteria bacterium]|nr:DUF3617 family protein [Pseudomonadota bacterium]
PPLPKMKAGLWETSTMSDQAKAKGQPARVSSICLDDATQKLLVRFSQGMMKGLCTKNDLVITGSTITGDAVCEVMGSKIASKSVMKFTGDTAYHTEARATYAPPLMGMTEGHTVVDGRWTGPCPAGMVPGDMKLPTGTTINLKTIVNDGP